MGKRRRFGRVRKLPSGRYQARYAGPDGLDRPAPETFATKRDAETWLVTTEAEILADDWINPDAGRIPFGDYADQWIDERPDLRPKRWSCTVTCCAVTWFRHSGPGPWLTSRSRTSGG